MLELGCTSDPWKRFKTEEIRNKIRRKHGVPLPEDEDLHGPICEEMVRETGEELKWVVGYYNYEKMVAYWRRNREKFLERGIRPLTVQEKIEKSRKKEEEYQAWWDSVREKRARKYNEANVKYPRGTWEHYFQQFDDEKRMREMEEVQERAVEAQMEAMKAVVADLPSQLPKVGVEVGSGADMDKKGKRTMVDDAGTSGGHVDEDSE